jgi:tRNA 2-thiocytidine biosynthesis protein TtcA
MPPKLVSDDGQHIVIRPLAYCKEPDLEQYALLRNFPIIPCNLCGSQDHLQRQVVKEMIRDWDKRFPGRSDTMFAALQRVSPSHLLDAGFFDFRGLETQDGKFVEGDIGFDPGEFSGNPIQLPNAHKILQK